MNDFFNNERPIELDITSETIYRLWDLNIAVIRAQPGYSYGKPVAKAPDVVAEAPADAAGPSKRELRRRTFRIRQLRELTNVG